MRRNHTEQKFNCSSRFDYSRLGSCWLDHHFRHPVYKHFRFAPGSWTTLQILETVRTLRGPFRIADLQSRHDLKDETPDMTLKTKRRMLATSRLDLAPLPNRGGLPTTSNRGG